MVSPSFFCFRVLPFQDQNRIYGARITHRARRSKAVWCSLLYQFHWCRLCRELKSKEAKDASPRSKAKKIRRWPNDFSFSSRLFFPKKRAIKNVLERTVFSHKDKTLPLLKSGNPQPPPRRVAGSHNG